ncbi:MAG: alpha/beta fold hydrolase [Dehalococcoidia bacterium]
MTDERSNRVDARPRGLRWGRIFRLLAAPVAVLAFLALVGMLWESRSEAADALAYPPPGHLIDVGGYRLHLVCTGSGSPTVVIDAGLGDWSTGWALVQPEVAKTTRVCAYDRAGSGWSDRGPQPRVASTFSRELHTLLVNAGEPGPYVMVGHSMGGLTTRLFARDYATDVRGLVLIESMNAIAPPPAADVPTPERLPWAVRAAVRGVARVGLVRALTFLGDPLGSAPRELSPEASAATAARGVTPDHLEAFVDEFRGISEGLAQAAEVRDVGALPVTVVTAGKKASDAEWPAKQADLLRLSSNSRQVIVGERPQRAARAPGGGDRRDPRDGEPSPVMSRVPALHESRPRPWLAGSTMGLRGPASGSTGSPRTDDSAGDERRICGLLVPPSGRDAGTPEAALPLGEGLG